MPKKNTDEPAGDGDFAVPALRITSAVDGFRRAGVAHSKRATEYPADAFSPEQIEALQAEPNLVVEIL